MKQKGWTLIELLSGLAILASLAVLGLVGYAAWHFVSKFW